MSFGTDCSEELASMFGDAFYYAHRGGKDAEKLQKAADAYASVWLDDEEEIVLVHDATLFGSADEGITLSTKHVFYKNDITGLSLTFEYEDFDDVVSDEANDQIVLQRLGEPDMYIAEGYSSEERAQLCAAIRFMKETAAFQPRAEAYEAVGTQAPFAETSLGEPGVQPSAMEPVVQVPPAKPKQPSKAHRFLEWADAAVEQAVQAQAAYTASKATPKRAEPARTSKRPVTVQAKPASSAATCKSCGAKLMPNAKFCSSCGAPVAPPAARPTQCAICGAPLAEHARFCSECGYPVEE